MSSEVETLETFVEKVDNLLEFQQQSVVFFTGVPGCGKSFLSKKFWEETKHNSYRPINPDNFITYEATKRGQTYTNFYNESSFKTALYNIHREARGLKNGNLIVDNTVFSENDINLWLLLLDRYVAPVVVAIEHNESSNRNKLRTDDNRIPKNVYDNFVDLYSEFYNIEDSKRPYKIVRVQND